MIGALALSACGGPSPTASAGSPASAGPTVAATAPAATIGPTTAATAPASTAGTAVDPADDLKIAAPYTLDALDENVAAMFVTMMEQSIGDNAGDFDLGIRSASKGGPQPVAIIVVMSFHDLPVGVGTLLDATAGAASGSGGKVESRDIAGSPVRIIDTQGQSIVFTTIGENLVMVVATTGVKQDNVDVTTAILEAN
jgi:hypothetical protein